MIKRLLRYLHKHHKAQYASILYEDVKRPKDFPNMEHCFVDSNGVNYYTWPDKGQIPMGRNADAESLAVQIMLCISKHGWGEFVTKMEKDLYRQVDGLPSPYYGGLAVLLKEMDQRAKLAMHPQLMWELVATLYIREDESPYHISDILLSQKVEQFKKDAGAGIHDFFAKGYIQKYLPYLNMPEKEWTQHWQTAEWKLKAMGKLLKISTKELEQIIKSGEVSTAH